MTSVGRTLVIDDDPDFVACYRDILEAAGLVVETAQTGDEAVLQLETVGAELDVVLLDLELRGPGGTKSGLDLIPPIRTLAPFAAIILVTAYATSSTVNRALKLGAHDYLIKSGPFEQSLLTKVRHTISSAQERRRVHH